MSRIIEMLPRIPENRVLTVQLDDSEVSDDSDDSDNISELERRVILLPGKCCICTDEPDYEVLLRCNLVVCCFIVVAIIWFAVILGFLILALIMNL
jgi:hypothetical protein